jgi:hypothetical protein
MSGMAGPSPKLLRFVVLYLLVSTVLGVLGTLFLSNWAVGR